MAGEVYTLDEKSLKLIHDMLNWWRRSGGVDLTSGPNIRECKQIFYGITQVASASCSSKYLLVKRWHDGAAVGDAVEAEVLLYGTSALSNCKPFIPVGGYVVIANINGVWQIIHPTFTYVGSSCA